METTINKKYKIQIVEVLIYEQITQKECTNMDQHVNSAVTSVEKNSESENNKLLASAAFLVAEMLGVKTRPKSGKSGKEPY